MVEIHPKHPIDLNRTNDKNGAKHTCENVDHLCVFCLGEIETPQEHVDGNKDDRNQKCIE